MDKIEQKIKEFIIKMNDKIVITFGSTLSLTAISLIESDLKSIMDSAVEERGKCNTCKELLPVECETCKRLLES